MRITLLMLAGGLSLALSHDTSNAPGGDRAVQDSVTATLHDSAGRDLGTLTLTDSAESIVVAGTLRGLPPGTHAIHIHTTGQCDAPGFESAGGHWNPTNKQHGSENPQGPHFGDLTNITATADSSVTVHATTPGGSLRGTNALLDADGAAVVVHVGQDDYHTDPAGGAGDRMACGIVTPAAG